MYLKQTLDLTCTFASPKFINKQDEKETKLKKESSLVKTGLKILNKKYSRKTSNTPA